MIVYVVGFAPANEAAAVGGFDWFPDAGAAIDRLRDLLSELRADRDAHSLTFVPLDVPEERYFQPGTREVDREGVTSWIDAHLELVEVGAAPSVPAMPCVIYGCGEPAEGESKIEFALPGGGTVAARVCRHHRESLSEALGNDVNLESGDALRITASYEPDRPSRTRPSAIVRRPDPEAPISETTVAELLTEALERANAARDAEIGFADALIGQRRGGKTLSAARVRELSIFVTLVEDAITRHNKAVYMSRGVFAITDAERIPE